MSGRAETIIRRLMAHEGLVWACFIAQLLLYWVLAFVMPLGNELVAYQRY